MIACTYRAVITCCYMLLMPKSISLEAGLDSESHHSRGATGANVQGQTLKKDVTALNILQHLEAIVPRDAFVCGVVLSCNKKNLKMSSLSLQNRHDPPVN